MNWLLGAGGATRNFVLDAAGLLRQEAAPGWIVLILLFLLLVALVHLIVATRSRRSALRWLRKTLEESGKRAQFNTEIDQLSRKIEEWGAKGGARTVAAAWREYVETLVRHDQDEGVIIRNAVRPGVFFNLEDLHFGPGFWRILPGLFVTIGLFLTFLGLISALHGMADDMKDAGGQLTSSAMSQLLGVASAKFIMSLTGLLCSIVFTIALRHRMGGVEGAINALCHAIEKQLSFISLEDLAVEQLRATREQKDHFRHIGMELVAELGRPLREELPRAVSASISEVMKPLITQVTQMGTDGVGGMVKDLSSQFSEDVGRALGTAGEQLQRAGDRIGELIARMDQSSGRMGSEMQGVVERLARAVEEMQVATATNVNATRQAFGESADGLLAAMQKSLENIQANTREGASAINESADAMRRAAEIVREQMTAAAEQGSVAARARLDEAGTRVQAALGDAAAGVANVLEKITGQTAQAFLDPIGDISAKMREVVEVLGSASSEMGRLSDSVREGANATGDAANSLRGSSQSLVAAIEPVRATASSIEQSIRGLNDSTAHVAAATRQNVESSAHTLAAAELALDGKREAVQAAMEGIATALDKLRAQGEQLDDIDRKLGAALSQYKDQVEAAVASLFAHVRQMQEEMTPALGTMREIVEQAEQFMPQSTGRS
jgi:methyl-accepting chemotaxis protein